LNVVIERVHLGDFTRSQAVDIWQGDRRRRIEVRARRLNRDDEARLLAEAGHHRHLVAMHDRDGHAAGLGTAGERDLSRADGQ
jgi:hypothetical protein